MMTWNYRVLKRRQKDGSWIFGIHEVFYDDETGAPFAFTEEPVHPFGTSFKELQRDLENMRSDIRKADPISMEKIEAKLQPLSEE